MLARLAEVETVGFMRVAWKDFPEALVADVHERLRHYILYDVHILYIYTLCVYIYICIHYIYIYTYTHIHTHAHTHTHCTCYITLHYITLLQRSSHIERREGVQSARPPPAACPRSVEVEYLRNFSGTYPENLGNAMDGYNDADLRPGHCHSY